MAEKISVEIGLEGGAEVEKQLEGIGKAGQQAFGEIQSAADQVNLSSTTEQFDDLGNAGASAFNKIKTAASSAVAFEQIIQGVKKVEGAFEALGNAATKVGARMTRALGPIGVFARALGPLGIAVGALGGALVKFGDDAAEAFNKLTVAGAKLGQTPQQFDRLQLALGRLGISADAIIPGLTKFRETLGADFTGDVTAEFQRFIAQLERMPDGVQRTQLAIATLDEALGGQVIASLQTGTVSAQNFATALGQVTPATQAQIVASRQYQEALTQLGAAWTELKRSLFTPITTPVLQFLADELRNLAIDIRNIRLEWELAKAIFATFTASGPEAQKKAAEEAAAAYQRLGTAGQQAGQQAAQGAFVWNEQTLKAAEASRQAAEATNQATQATEQYKSSASGITSSFAWSSVVSGWDAITGAIGRAIDALLRYLGLRAQAPATGGGGAPGAARGGLIGGRGSGTSDSNLAWVSRGEHIMPARAVAQPGVLGFLEALRRSGGNLRGVLDGMGRFALGGLVPRPAMAFAGGGAVGSMSNVTINFPGLPPVGGLRASSAVVDELQRAAALAQVRSGGRKPSRYS